MSWFKWGIVAFLGGGLMMALVIYFFRYGQEQMAYRSLNPQLKPPPLPEILCGGFNNKPCPAGYHCQIESKEVGAQGKCLPQKTFQLFPQNKPEYGCPVGGWLDCMGFLPESAKKLCTQEFFQWAQANCPDFKGFNY